MYYNYEKAVRDDVREFCENELDFSEWAGRRDELEEKLNEDLWTNDSVTGNGSGSYTFSSSRAMEYLSENLDLLAEACDEFGGSYDVLKDGAEACDVTIRCYLLAGAISDILDEYQAAGKLDESDEEAAEQ